MDHTETKYSIAIRTLGKSGDMFVRELESIKRQTTQPERVIIYIAEGYDRPDYTIGKEEYVWVKKGMVAQRALPYDEIESPLLMLLDDDVELAPDSAERLIKAMKEFELDCIAAETMRDNKRPLAIRIYAAFTNAYQRLPVSPTLIGNNTLVKASFDDIITEVETINGCAAVIVGTKTALKSLNALTDVNWRSLSQKESVAASGRLGTYEGTEMIEIPNRYLDRSLTTKAFSDKTLLILPVIEDKFVKVVDQGETEIYQITEKGEENGRWDDVMKYEMTRGFGVGVQLGRYFGIWTLP